MPIPLFPQIPHKTQRVYVYTHSVDPIDRANVSRASPHCSYVVSWKALRRRWQTPVIHPKCIFSVSNELLLWSSVVLRGSWGGSSVSVLLAPMSNFFLEGNGSWAVNVQPWELHKGGEPQRERPLSGLGFPRRRARVCATRMLYVESEKFTDTLNFDSAKFTIYVPLTD